jgi:CheY-like chemotaxis protein/anti-sigma regulatory factor (Ser/Thr protein kinase)
MSSVLVVDDSAVDRRLVRGLLERTGEFDVSEAVDGEDALLKIGESIPDVVVTDLIMPRRDGFGLVAAIKEEHPSIPVILITGRGSEDIAAKALQHGAASYVGKVSLADDLVPTIQRVLTASREDRTHARLLHHMGRCELEFSLRNDLALIGSAVNLLQVMLRCLPLGDEIERLRVGIAVEEALKNAYLHGNLGIGGGSPRPRRDEFGPLAAQRVYALPYRDRRIHLQCRITRLQAQFVVRDEGDGFNVKAWLQEGALSDQDASTTRGISLIRTIMDEVRYNDRGNEVTLVKHAVVPQPGDTVEETAAHTFNLGEA